MHVGWMFKGREVSKRCRVYNDCRRCQLLRLSQGLHDQIRWILRRYVSRKRYYFKTSKILFINNCADNERHAKLIIVLLINQIINLHICRYKRVYRGTSSLRLRCRMHQSTRLSSMCVSAWIRRRSVQRPLFSSPEEMYQRQRMQG